MKRRTLAVALAVAVAVVSGCGLIGDGGTEPKGRARKNVNTQEAADRAEQILDGTFQGIRPGVETRRGPSSDCAAPTSGTTAPGLARSSADAM